MRQKIVSLAILTVALLGVGLAVGWQRSSDSSGAIQATEKARTAVRVGAAVFEVELALSAKQQETGLSRRDKLATNQGMLFVFEPAAQPLFWMHEMRFPIDIIWIYQGKIVGISPNLPVPKSGTPADELPTYQPNSLVDYALEVNAGAAKELKIGDRFELIDSFSA